MLKQLLQIALALNTRRDRLQRAETAKVVERNRQRCIFEGGEVRLEIHDDQTLFLVVIAAEYKPFLILGAFLDGPDLFFEEEGKVAGALEVELEGFDGFFSLIADEEVDLQVIGRCVDVIERHDLAPDLQLLVLKQDVLGFQTLLFEAGTLFLPRQVLLKISVVHN